MPQKAQVILMGHLTPEAACRNIEVPSFAIALQPAEEGWTLCNLSFQLYHDQVFVVVDYEHADAIDRGHAVAKMRRTVKNLVNWVLLTQSLAEGAPVSLADEQTVARYETDTLWVSQLDPSQETPPPPPLPTSEGIKEGVACLPFLLSDPMLRFAIQDYSASLEHPEFALFMLWRSLEWILHEYDPRPNGTNSAYAPTETELQLPSAWLSEIAGLAHPYARHAQLRADPHPALVDAARARVRQLIMRHLRHRHSYPDQSLPPIEPDALTGWKAPI